MQMASSGIAKLGLRTRLCALEKNTISYHLTLGVYDPQTMDRLAAANPDGTPVANDRVVLGEVVAVP